MNDPNLSILLEVAEGCGRTTTNKVRKRFELMDEIIDKCWDYVNSASPQDEAELKELLQSATEEEYEDSPAYNEEDEEDD